MGAVGGEVLAFDVGVDRHLCNFASTNWLDEVDGHRATALFKQCFGALADLDFHWYLTHFFGPTQLSSRPSLLLSGY